MEVVRESFLVVDDFSSVFEGVQEDRKRGGAWEGFMAKVRPEDGTTNQYVYVSLSIPFSLLPL